MRFLLAASGPGGRSRILDQVRAEAVRRLADDPDLLRGSDWAVEGYSLSLAFLDGLARREIGASAAPRRLGESAP